MREKRGFGPWGWLLLIFGLLVFFSNGGFFADGTNIISPAVAERLNVDQSIILTMNSVAGIVGVLIAVAAGQVNQRIGPSKVAAGCLILAGLGHIAACNAVNVPMYLIAMCFVGGGLSSGSFVGVGTLVSEMLGESIVAAIVGGYGHDGSCSVSCQYVIADPDGHCFTCKRIDSIRTAENTGHAAVGDAFAFRTFLGAVKVGVYFCFL